jgi:DNA-binding MarR family transcriptional regulator
MNQADNMIDEPETTDAAQARWSGALDQIMELAVLVNEDMTGTLAKDGLTTARAHLLWELRRHGPLTQRALAQALRVSARNITGLVDGMVKTGFVSRQPHPGDRRATLVTCTELGTRTAARMESDQREFCRLLFAGMPEPRFAGLVEGLDDVLTRLRAALAADQARQER